MLVRVNIFFREYAVNKFSWMVPALAILTSTCPSAFAGLTASDTETVAPRNQVVGSLPYSNQWVFDQRQSYLYLSYNHGALAAPVFHSGVYSSNFANQKTNFCRDFNQFFVDASPHYSCSTHQARHVSRSHRQQSRFVYARDDVSGFARYRFINH